jgi:glycerophosphoryl diester phosphodiesterase
MDGADHMDGGAGFVRHLMAVINTRMKQRVMIAIAHRGASAWAPENTVAAFDAALEVNCRAIEFDVRLTSDGVPVVIHDETLDRTTNGSGRVAETAWLDILRLDAGSWKQPRFAGARVPTLEEALQAICPAARPIIELKVAVDPLMLINLLQRHRAVRDAVVMSFDLDILQTIRRENRDLMLFQIVEHWSSRTISDCRGSGCSGLVMRFDMWALDRAVAVKKVLPHAWAYNVNDPGAAAACGAMGIDGVITDYPDLVRAQARGPSTE